MTECRGCRSANLSRVLDLGTVPAADYFPLATEPVASDEATHALAMDLCADCFLAQLADDDTVADEPRGVEPQALKDQAAEAVTCVADAGWLRGNTVREFGSPHGGTWLPLLTERGYRSVAADPADIVLDCFGMMHEPDQRAAFAQRAAATGPDGVLLIQFHSLAAIVRDGQWNALRHGHFGYYSLQALLTLLANAGLRAVRAWEFDLYGGTILVAAVHGYGPQGLELTAIADRERGLTDRIAVNTLQDAASAHIRNLRKWADGATGQRVYAYGAASRAVALFAMAGLTRDQIAGVADASPAKQGRRMPGTDVPIVSPQHLIDANPDRVLLTVPDLFPEVQRLYPSLTGRWFVPASTTGDVELITSPTVGHGSEPK